jgi:3-hydroxy-9,10-secoandrosta-1,3,5(10)-triene-9,17-dione monooxygenase reductase component
VAARHFAVHVLASDQEDLAERFSRKGIERFAGLTVARGVDGIALLEGCAARFECRTAFQYDGGDHIIFVGEVQKFTNSGHEPLVYKRGRFALAVGKSASEPAPAMPAESGAFEAGSLVYLLGRAYHQLFARIRPELTRRGIGEAEYHALSLLGLHDGRTVLELDAMLAYTGTHVDRSVGQRLIALALVDSDGASADSPRLNLTEAGQRCLVELKAVAQAASDDGAELLDHSEALVLRQLLARVVRASDLAD